MEVRGRSLGVINNKSTNTSTNKLRIEGEYPLLYGINQKIRIRSNQ